MHDHVLAAVVSSLQFRIELTKITYIIRSLRLELKKKSSGTDIMITYSLFMVKKRKRHRHFTKCSQLPEKRVAMDSLRAFNRTTVSPQAQVQTVEYECEVPPGLKAQTGVSQHGQ